MKIHGTAKGGALSTKDFGVAFGGAAAIPFDKTELLSYHKFNESSPDNIINQAESVGSTDSLGSAADIIITGATYDVDGILGKALSFDGVNDYGNIGTSLNQYGFVYGTDDWSFNWWCYPLAFDTSADWLSSLDSTETRGFHFGLRGGEETTKFGVSIYKAPGDYTFNGGFAWGETLLINTWYMMTVTSDYSNTVDGFKIYLNGAETATSGRGAWVGGGGDAEHPLAIMSNGGNTAVFQNARLDEMSIFKRTLSPTEITTLYNSGDALAL